MFRAGKNRDGVRALAGWLAKMWSRMCGENCLLSQNSEIRMSLLAVLHRLRPLSDQV